MFLGSLLNKQISMSLDPKNHSYMRAWFQTNKPNQADCRETTTILELNVRIVQYCVVPARRASEMKLSERK